MFTTGLMDQESEPLTRKFYFYSGSDTPRIASDSGLFVLWFNSDFNSIINDKFLLISEQSVKSCDELKQQID